jgi:uncharacterized protein
MTDLPTDLSVKWDALLTLLRSFGSCAVAFSGGLDSTILAYAAQQALGEKAVAITGASASLAVHELDECRALAGEIGIRHLVVPTEELANPEYRKNAADRCYHCKTELFARLEGLAQQFDSAVVVDGSNWDDRGEHRPGMQAARDRKVRSPLAECRLTKAELRTLAAHWGLRTWNKPASPCLSSRIAYGETVTPERLAMVERAERFLRERGFQPLRVRYHKGDMARIEVSADVLPRLVEPSFRRELVEAVRAAGFQYVTLDLEGFRSGSMNAVLPVESLAIASREKPERR